MLKCNTLSQLSSVQDVAKSLELYTRSLRRAFHKIPELSWKEEKTLTLIKEEIGKLAKKSCFATKLTETQGGIWVDLLVDPSLPWILFRSDTDGLPIEEATNLSFSSEHKGVMHACGHDFHIAMLLASFKAITLGAVIPKANIRFVWQRAEECGRNPSGGSLLVKNGVCDNIDFAYGLHISSTLDLNLFCSRQHLMMSNSSYIDFTISCSGGHVMRPDLGSNGISLMIDILSHMKGFEKLFFGPEEPIAFVPSIATAGTTQNIRPNSAHLCFAIRNFLTEQKRTAFIKAVRQKIETIVSLYSTAKLSSFDFYPGYPALYNDPNNYFFVEDALHEQGFQTAPLPPLFSGEDFAYYLQEVPGSFWCLGAKQGECFDHHTPQFNPSEASLPQGTAFWLTLAQKSPA